jgi:AraC-like DNA-binding protein
MAHLETFSTAGMDPRRKFEYWNETACASFTSNAHRIRIVNYIEAHLGDPDLTPMRVAVACKMTARYLHHLFSHGSETVARYILRRRLEECSRALTIPSQRGRTVTAIAFDYGFNSPTHFGRVFRARFGVTPREFRIRGVS